MYGSRITRSEICLVRMWGTFYEAGSFIREYPDTDLIDPFLCVDIQANEAIKSLDQLYDNHLKLSKTENDCGNYEVIKSFMSIAPVFCSSGKMSLIDYDIEQIGVEEVFGDWLCDISKMILSKIIGEKHSSSKIIKDTDVFDVSYTKPEIDKYGVVEEDIITVWRYSVVASSSCDYSGDEYDGEINLLGSLNMNKILTVIDPI